MKIKTIYFLIFLLFACSINTAFAQISAFTEEELFMEIEDVFSSSFFKISSKKAPGFTYIINKNHLENSTARSLHELIEQRVPGTAMSYHFFGSLMSQRGIQIDSNAKTIFMLDGNNLNTRHHFGTMLALDIPLIKDLESVEVVNGPGALVHGSGAINGFVNMIPKTGKNNPDFSLSNEIGFIDRMKKIEMQYGIPYKNGDLYIYFGTITADGFRPEVDTLNKDKTDNIDEYNRVKYGAYRARTFIDDNYKFTLNWNHDSWNLLTQYWTMNTTSLSPWPGVYRSEVTNNSTLQHQATVWGQTSLLIRPKYIWELDTKEDIEIIASIYLIDNANYDFKNEEMVENFTHNQTSEEEYKLKSIFKTTKYKNHQLALGGSASKRYFHHLSPIFREFDDTSEKGYFKGYTGNNPYGKKYFSWLETGLFAEDIIDVSDAMTLSLGLRYDKVEYSSDSVKSYDNGQQVNIPLDKDPQGHYSPRLAMAYELTDNSSVKISYQHGFRHPDMANIIQKHPSVNSIESEKMDSIEINYNHSFMDETLDMDFNLFYNTHHDTIAWKTFEIISGNVIVDKIAGFANIPDDFASGGFEIIAKYKLNHKSRLDFSYSYVKPFNISNEFLENEVMQISSDKERFARYPQHIIKTNYSTYLMDDKLYIDTNLIYYSPASDSYSTKANRSFKKPTIRVNVMGKYNFSKNLYAKATILNLFENEASRPAWSVNSDGVPGIEARLFYLEIGSEF